MQQQSRQVQVGDEVLAENRHLCGLFDGPEAAATVVLPFVLEGLRQGNRVVYLSEDRDALRDRLSATVDVASAVDSGQLDIRAWTDSYLVDGTFSGSRSLAFLRRALREGSALGYGVTRMVGEMEWAQEGVPGVEELISYESGVDAILGQPPHAVICAYDVRRHSASRIAAVLAAHQAAFVGGRLQRTDRLAQRTARDRILSAASYLFGEAGVMATGVDTLIASAGVAKATFYRHFPSKDNLIVAWLEDPRTRWFEAVRARAEARAESPGDVVTQLFGAVAEWLEAGDFRGCPYLNTAVELPDPDHPASPVIRSYLSEIEGYLAEILAAAGYREALTLATELQTMLAGSIALGVAHRTGSFALAAREGAIRLLRDAERT